jgi:hypothetical protein
VSLAQRLPERSSAPGTQAVICVLLAACGALAGLIGAFLVPLEIGGTAIGVSDVIALVGNLALGRFAAAATGSRAGPLASFLGWLVVAVLAGVRRGSATDPSLIVWSSIPGIHGAAAVGLLFYGLGAVAGTIAIGRGRDRGRGRGRSRGRGRGRGPRGLARPVGPR